MRPIVFRNAVPKILAEGRRPIDGVQWPAVYGWYGRELAPAAALLATDRELVLVSEKSSWVHWPRQAKYGCTHLNSNRYRLESYLSGNGVCRELPPRADNNPYFQGSP